LDGVVTIAQAVPLGALGLGTVGQVGGPGAEDDDVRLLHTGDQLPPLPAVAIALTAETRLLPAAGAHAHFHARNRGRARPGHAADGQLTALDLRIGRWIGDQ